MAEETGARKGEAFLCPFCGAPYREFIPADVVQVKCRYCGSTILVPSLLERLAERCPNHPDTAVAGICSICGKSFCDQCLYIMKVSNEWEGHLTHVYACPECLKRRNVPLEAAETLHSRNERKQALQRMSTGEIINQLVEYSSYDSKYLVDEAVKDYMNRVGLSRGEAVLEVALNEGLPKPPKPPPRPPTPEEIEAEKRWEEKLRRLKKYATIVICILVVGGVAGVIYTHGESIGTPLQNWDRIGTLSQGVHVLITPSDPRTMNDTDLNTCFSNKGSRDSFVSLVVCKVGIAEMTYEEAIIKPLMKQLEVKTSYYSCGPGETNTYFYTYYPPAPRNETVVVFLGKLPPGEYRAVFYSYHTGWVRTVHLNMFGDDMRQTDTSVGGKTDTYETTFTIR